MAYCRFAAAHSGVSRNHLTQNNKTTAETAASIVEKYAEKDFENMRDKKIPLMRKDFDIHIVKKDSDTSSGFLKTLLKKIFG